VRVKHIVYVKLYVAQCHVIDIEQEVMREARLLVLVRRVLGLMVLMLGLILVVPNCVP
jgi:hypothetical protein